MDIQLKKIKKSYDESGSERVIFNNMQADFLSGQFCVIVGKSGVGKSSLLNLISGIDLPESGTVKLGSHSLNTLNDDERTVFRRKHVGFIYQFFNLIPVLSVFENITLIAELDRTPRKYYQEQALFLLDKVGLTDRKNEYPDRLSGGEQQRVAIVRALINDPDIILADEPTGNLDSDTGKRVLDLIADLISIQKKTLVMVTHSPEAMKYADQVWRVEKQNLAKQTI